MRMPALVLAVTASVLVAVPASATIVILPYGSIPSDNFVLNNGKQSGTSVVGTAINGSTVTFTGTTADGGSILRTRGGPTRVESDGTLSGLTSIMFDLAGGRTFNDLSFNLFRGSGTATSVTFNLIDNMGNLFTFDEAITRGKNLFAFQGIDGQSIASFSASFDGTGVRDLRQISLTDILNSSVPEPASWAMMIGGFGMIGGVLRRREKLALAAA